MVYEILEELKAEPGKNNKIAILKKHRDNELLKQVLFAALDPYTQYFIKKIPDYTPCEHVDAALNLPMQLDEALDSLPVLSTREFTGHDAINFLAALLGDLSFEDANVIERVIKKNLDCGVQASTVNKVWPKLIPTYPCLLAKSYDEKTITRMEWPAYSQLKADGMRINAFVEKGKVTLRGRSGRPVDLLGELDKDILELAKNVPLKGGFVFDGELVVQEKDGTIMERRKGNGLLNKAIKGTIGQKDAARVLIRVWDVIPLKDFKAEKCKTPYHLRWEMVSSAYLESNTVKVELIETRLVKDLAEAEEHFNEMLKRGEEGTILKNRNHIWEDKRSYGLIKMKAEKDADLKVIGWVEGTGKYVGKLGALICRSSDGKVEVSVGSGFTDEERETLTEDVVIDKVITVLYNERIKSKAKDRADVDSLFLPRFVELREDKNVANSSKEIK